MVGRCISFWDGLFSGANCQPWKLGKNRSVRSAKSIPNPIYVPAKNSWFVGWSVCLFSPLPISQCDRFSIQVITTHLPISRDLFGWNYKYPYGTNPQMPGSSLRSCDAKFRNPGFMDLINNCSEDSSFCFTWQNLDLTIQVGNISTPVVKA